MKPENNETKHTALPWVHNGNAGHIGTECMFVCDGENRHERAQLIVRAVNNHDKLVEALRRVLEDVNRPHKQVLPSTVSFINELLTNLNK